MQRYKYIDIPDDMKEFINNSHRIKSKNNKPFTNITYSPTYFRKHNTQEIMKLLEISHKLLNDNGFSTVNDFKFSNKLNVIIEFHNYNIPTNNNCYNSQFIKHCDDHGAVNANVNTIIYYVEKSSSLDGGDLTIFKDENNIDTTLNIQSDKMLMIRGDVFHEITPLKGHGVRKSIVVQIERCD